MLKRMIAAIWAGLTVGIGGVAEAAPVTLDISATFKGWTYQCHQCGNDIGTFYIKKDRGTSAWGVELDETTRLVVTLQPTILGKPGTHDAGRVVEKGRFDCHFGWSNLVDVCSGDRQPSIGSYEGRVLTSRNSVGINAYAGNENYSNQLFLADGGTGSLYLSEYPRVYGWRYYAKFELADVTIPMPDGMVPLPGTAAGLLTGLAALAGLRARRRS